jgi:hypothetical protein
MSIRSWALFCAVSCALAACGAPRESAPPTATAAALPAEPNLFDALRQVERPESSLLALPVWARDVARKQLGQLSAEEQSELAAGSHPLAEQHPLLHWEAGGHALDVLRAAVLTPALVEEWTALTRERVTPVADDELVRVGNELVRRAALLLLRERAADFAPGRSPSQAALSDVARTAERLGVEPVATLAAEAWAESADDPEALSFSSRRAARALDVPGTEAVVARFPDAPESAERKERARNLAAAARRVTQGGADPLALARDYSDLGRHDLALVALAKGSDDHLGRVTELVRAELEASVCPGVLMPNLALCRAAFAEQARRRRSWERLDAAWASSMGRDGRALEHYIGLRFVTRMMYRIDDTGQGLDGAELARDLEALGAAAEEGVAVDARFAALALISRSLLEALRAGSAAAPSTRPEIPPARRAELRQSARELVSKSPSSWSSSAALAGLALSLQDDALGPDLDAIGAEFGTALPAAWSALELWTALGDGDAKRLAGAKARLVEVLHDTKEDERAGWLLSFAEADAVLRPGEQTSATLLHLCERLGQEQVPVPLILRAQLDKAGIHARALDSTAAERDLSQAMSSSAGPEATRGLDSLILVAGFIEVLRSARDSERETALAALTELLDRVRRDSAGSPSIVTWLELWQREIRTQIELARCGKQHACQKRAEAARGISRALVASRLGQRTADLFARGVVPLGGAEIDIGYDGNAVVPRVGLELAFPLVPVPELD